MILPLSFYQRDAIMVARELLGQILTSQTAEGETTGRIVETEAYLSANDLASHARPGETKRNQVMFGPAGRAYIYFTYGMHYCFNIVTGKPGVGEAVLIRALEPVQGLELMQQRRNTQAVAGLCNGPAKLVRALGIGSDLNGHPLIQAPLWLDAEEPVGTKQIAVGPRIGIRRSAELPLRFYLKANQFISR